MIGFEQGDQLISTSGIVYTTKQKYGGTTVRGGEQIVQLNIVNEVMWLQSPQSIAQCNAFDTMDVAFPVTQLSSLRTLLTMVLGMIQQLAV